MKNPPPDRGPDRGPDCGPDRAPDRGPDAPQALAGPAAAAPPVAVRLWAGLRRFTDGALVVEVRAATVGQMLDALVAAHPGLAPAIRAGVTVAVDGVVLTDARHRPIPPGAEVVLMQRVKGG